jgi:hypothetical protein
MLAVAAEVELAEAALAEEMPVVVHLLPQSLVSATYQVATLAILLERR